MCLRYIFLLFCVELCVPAILSGQVIVPPDTNSVSVPVSDPQTVPVVTEPSLLPVESLPEGSGSSKVVTTEYWRIGYHPELTQDVFKLISYPYYPGGQSFVRSSEADLAAIYISSEVQPTQKRKFNSELLKALNSLVAELVIQQLELEKPAVADEDKAADNGGIVNKNPKSDPNYYSEIETYVASTSVELDVPENENNEVVEYRGYIEHCSDLIFRWRQINESPLFLLELLRAIKITQSDNGIYQRAPEIAVQIKRNIGTIAKINKNFDFTSRIAIESTLAGEYPKSWISRMEKQVADLSNRAIALRDLNDKATVALGLGTIDRTGDVLRYYPLNFEQIVKPDKFEVK